MAMIEAALALRQAGLSVLPAIPAEKRPSLSGWKAFQQALPGEAQIRSWFANSEGACLVCGAVSGNLEMIDFDMAGELFPAWRDRVIAEAPGLLDKLVIERTPSGGKHIVYRCDTPAPGNAKLAQRVIQCPDETEIVLAGKAFKPRKVGDRFEVLVTLIETRGEGGLFLCAPTQGYALEQGAFANLPDISAAEREILIASAKALNEIQEPAAQPIGAGESQGRPGDDFNDRGDVRPILLKHGWSLVRDGENSLWRRPGKTEGWSATLKDRVFFCHSTNASPFEAPRAYAPFAVYALLEHQGDYAKAAATLRSEGYGATDPGGVNLSGLLSVAAPDQQVPLAAPRSLRQLMSECPELRKPVIHTLLREGETMNVIAASKAGKSWMVIDLALSVVTGRPWLGIPCEPGEVLLIDNELHGETSANRIPRVAQARGIRLPEILDRLYVQNLRGSLQDIFSMESYFRQFAPGRFKLVILDAFYRFLPMRADENDNATMANLYNRLDAYADMLKCSFVLIHHTSKGNQSAKEVTDVGAGAGAQSRATDTHLVLRRHEQDDVVVLDAAVRSWPPVAPRCLRWTFPVWTPADDLSPDDLRQEGKKRPPKGAPPPQPKEPEWDADMFVMAFVSDEPRAKPAILVAANDAGLSDYKADRLLEKAEARGLIHRWDLGRKRTGYATVPEPVPLAETDASKREIVEAALRQSKDGNSAELAEKCGVSVRYVQRIRRELGGEQTDEKGCEQPM